MSTALATHPRDFRSPKSHPWDTYKSYPSSPTSSVAAAAGAEVPFTEPAESHAPSGSGEVALQDAVHHDATFQSSAPRTWTRRGEFYTPRHAPQVVESLLE